MLPGIFYAFLGEGPVFRKNPPAWRWLPCVGGAFFASLGASKPISGGILLLLRTLRQINLENGRKVCYNLG